MTAKVTIETVSESGDAQRDLNKLGKSVEDAGEKGKEADKQFKLFGLSLTDLKSGLSLASDAINKIGEAYSKTIGVTVAYAEQVRDLGRLAGTSSEETSRLIQVADDLKVEYSSLTQAAKALAQDGIALTTEELAKASDEYLSFSDAGARAEYAVKKFGRSGLELTKILEAGGAELRKMAAEQDKNLILTEEQTKKARELEIAQDDLEDSIAGLTYQLSIGLIPKTTLVIKLWKDLITLDNRTWFQDGADASAKFLNQFFELQKATEGFSHRLPEAKRNLQDVMGVLAETSKTITSQTIPSLSDLALALQNEQGAYIDTGSAAKDYNNTLMLSGQAVDSLLAKYGSLTQAMIFNTLAQGMDKDAAMALGVSMGIITPQIMAARDAVDYLAASTSAAMKQTQSYVGQAEALAAAIAKLQDKSITITTYYNNVGQRSDNLTDPRGPSQYVPSGNIEFKPATTQAPLTPISPAPGNLLEALRAGGKQ